jgi:cysteine desulfurase
VPEHHVRQPSSDHYYGHGPHVALDQARDQVTALIGAGGGRIVFTGSGSEAGNLAIRGAVLPPGVTGHT